MSTRRCLPALAFLMAILFALPGCPERSAPTAGTPPVVVEAPKVPDPVTPPAGTATTDLDVARVCGTWKLKSVHRLSDGTEIDRGEQEAWLVLRPDHSMETIVKGEPPKSGTFEIILGKSLLSPQAPQPLLVLSDAPDHPKMFQLAEDNHLDLIDNSLDGKVLHYVACAPDSIPRPAAPANAEVELPKLYGTWKLMSVSGGMAGQTEDRSGSNTVLVLRPDNTAETLVNGVSTRKVTFKVVMGKSIFATEPVPFLVLTDVLKADTQPTPSEGDDPRIPVADAPRMAIDGEVIRLADDTLGLSDNFPDGFNHHYVRQQ